MAQTKMPWIVEILDGQTERMRVVGGWIVRDRIHGSMIWLKDADGEWSITEPKADPIQERSTLAEEFA